VTWAPVRPNESITGRICCVRTVFRAASRGTALRGSGSHRLLGAHPVPVTGRPDPNLSATLLP
jgi:hypothetical protein